MRKNLGELKALVVIENWRREPMPAAQFFGILASSSRDQNQLDIPLRRDLYSLAMVGGEKRCTNAHPASKAQKEIIIP